MKSFKIGQTITNRQDASLGIFFKEVSKLPLIDINEEIRLCHKIKEGDINARNKLVEANLRFVISVAKQYQNKGLPLVDLIQLGVLGIIEAAKKWDESRGFKFISYAVWWIRQSIIQGLSLESRTVKVPMNQVVTMNKINKIMDKFEQVNGRSPSYEELAEEIESSSDKIALTLSSINKSLSLDNPFADESGCLLDVIPNSNETDKELQQQIKTSLIHKVLDKLPKKERDVLKWSFGIDCWPMSLDEIGNKLNVGAERVRQIQKLALEKLRTRHGNLLKQLL